jgi:hypothetical protein
MDPKISKDGRIVGDFGTEKEFPDIKAPTNGTNNDNKKLDEFSIDIPEEGSEGV